MNAIIELLKIVYLILSGISFVVVLGTLWFVRHNGEVTIGYSDEEDED